MEIIFPIYFSPRLCLKRRVYNTHIRKSRYNSSLFSFYNVSANDLFFHFAQIRLFRYWNNLIRVSHSFPFSNLFFYFLYCLSFPYLFCVWFFAFFSIPSNFFPLSQSKLWIPNEMNSYVMNFEGKYLKLCFSNFSWGRTIGILRVSFLPLLFRIEPSEQGRENKVFLVILQELKIFPGIFSFQCRISFIPCNAKSPDTLAQIRLCINFFLVN